MPAFLILILDSGVGRWAIAVVVAVGLVFGAGWLLVHTGERRAEQRQAQQQAAQIEANRRAADAAQDRAAQDPDPQGTLQRDWSR